MTKTADDLIFEDTLATPDTVTESEPQPAPVMNGPTRKSATTLAEQKAILTDPESSAEAKQRAADILRCYAAGFKQYYDAGPQPTFGDSPESYAIYWGCFSCMIELGVDLDEKF